MSTSEGKRVRLVEVGALISWCIYSHRIVMLLVPYMWASMTFCTLSLAYCSKQSTGNRKERDTRLVEGAWGESLEEKGAGRVREAEEDGGGKRDSQAGRKREK